MDAYVRLGDAYININSPTDAIASFSHASKLDPHNESLALRIGKTLLCSHEYKQAVAHYEGFLTTSPDSNDVKLALDLLTNSFKMCKEEIKREDRKENDLLQACDECLLHSKVDEALKLCTDFMDTNSDHFQVLIKYACLVSNLGKRDELLKVLQKLEVTYDMRPSDASISFCKGICHRLLGDPVTALKCFDCTRRSRRWSEKAVLNMIEIYLRLDDFGFWCASSNTLAFEEESLKSIHALMKTINFSSERGMILKGYWDIVKALNDGHFDSATNHFNEILNDDESNIPALLGLAKIYRLSSTPTKVRNTLKKIAKTPHCFKYLQEYEKGYLMLAVDYLERDKADLAQDLCKRCLFYNRCCAKAWEILGRTFEVKGMDLSDIIECYEKSWAYGGNQSIQVGYRLVALKLNTGRARDGLKIVLRLQDLVPDNVALKDLFVRCLSLLQP